MSARKRSGSKTMRKVKNEELRARERREQQYEVGVIQRGGGGSGLYLHANPRSFVSLFVPLVVRVRGGCFFPLLSRLPNSSLFSHFLILRFVHPFFLSRPPAVASPDSVSSKPSKRQNPDREETGGPPGKKKRAKSSSSSSGAARAAELDSAIDGTSPDLFDEEKEASSKEANYAAMEKRLDALERMVEKMKDEGDGRDKEIRGLKATIRTQVIATGDNSRALKALKALKEQEQEQEQEQGRDEDNATDSTELTSGARNSEARDKEDSSNDDDDDDDKTEPHVASENFAEDGGGGTTDDSFSQAPPPIPLPPSLPAAAGRSSPSRTVEEPQPTEGPLFPELSHGSTSASGGEGGEGGSDDVDMV